MYAVISSGGKQYKVAKGEVIKLEKQPAEIDQIVEFPVLLVANQNDVKVGASSLAGSLVRGRVVEHGRGDKVIGAHPMAVDDGDIRQRISQGNGHHRSARRNGTHDHHIAARSLHPSHLRELGVRPLEGVRECCREARRLQSP